jgi:hypothetical protein
VPLTSEKAETSTVQKQCMQLSVMLDFKEESGNLTFVPPPVSAKITVF